MESVAEVLGDAVTPEVAEGWSEAVMHLAGILIDAEVTLLVFRFACTLDEQFTPYGLCAKASALDSAAARLANLFLLGLPASQEGLYAAAENRTGGWRGWRQFEVSVGWFDLPCFVHFLTPLPTTTKSHIRWLQWQPLFSCLQALRTAVS